MMRIPFAAATILAGCALFAQPAFPPLYAPAADVAAAIVAMRNDAAAPRVAVELLHEQSPLFAGRTPSEIARLRAQLFVTLATTGVPSDALPFVIGELAHGHKPVTLAAAARAAAAAGPSASAAVPHLVRLLDPSFHDEQVSLDAFEPAWPARDATNVRIEAVRALASFGEAASDALPALRDLAANRPLTATPLGGKLREEIALAIAVLEPRPSCHASAQPSAFASAFRERATRGNAAALAPQGKPVVLTFFYTRCDNDRKCATTMSRFAQLRAAASSIDVRFIAVTYDPEYDSDFHLARFAATRGLETGDDVRLLRLPPAELARLATSLGLSVNYADGRPNLHGVELFVLDRGGRVAREYRNVIWDEGEVLGDLRKLAAE